MIKKQLIIFSLLVYSNLQAETNLLKHNLNIYNGKIINYGMAQDINDSIIDPYTPKITSIREIETGQAINKMMKLFSAQTSKKEKCIWYYQETDTNYIFYNTCQEKKVQEKYTYSSKDILILVHREKHTINVKLNKTYSVIRMNYIFELSRNIYDNRIEFAIDVN